VLSPDLFLFFFSFFFPSLSLCVVAMNSDMPELKPKEQERKKV
jgi:hypothetical protein